jgi:YHS domain-containing protein
VPLCIALVGASPTRLAAPVSAATTERIVTDRLTGFAIGGFDPVAYFTDGKPVPGRAEFELSSAGVVWRFANEGNRAAFAANPDVYAPQFGGYDRDRARRIDGRPPGNLAHIEFKTLSLL